MLLTVGKEMDFTRLVVIFGAVGTLLMLSLPVLRLIVESFFCLLEDLLPELFLVEEDGFLELLEPLELLAPVILADEPTGSLDEDTAQGITSLLRESAHQMGKCVVVVTHSRELARDADVVFRLKRGTLVTA